MATYSITQEQLQHILDQHVEKLLSSGLIKKGKSAGKSAPKKASSSASDSDAASDSGSAKRAPNAWILFTARVRALAKEQDHKWEKPTDCQMFCSSLKEKTADYASWADEAILAALASWQRPEVSKAFQGLAGISKAGKKAQEERRSSEASETSAAAASASAPAEKKKPGRPKKSEEEKEAAKAAKKAEKEAEKAAKKEAKEAEKEAKKAEKKAAPAPKKAAPEPEEEEEEEEMEMSAIQVDGQDVFWNEQTGDLYENVEGALGELLGKFDGITLTPA